MTPNVCSNAGDSWAPTYIFAYWSVGCFSGFLLSQLFQNVYLSILWWIQTWPVHPVPHMLTLCRNTESSNPFVAETVDCDIKNSIVQRNIENNFRFLLPFILFFLKQILITQPSSHPYISCSASQVQGSYMLPCWLLALSSKEIIRCFCRHCLFALWD